MHPSSLQKQGLREKGGLWHKGRPTSSNCSKLDSVLSPIINCQSPTDMRTHEFTQTLKSSNYIACPSSIATLNLHMEGFPLGYRFLPTDEELVIGYLMNKVLGRTDGSVIPELEDFYAHDPWELPRQYRKMSNIPSDVLDWYFFCPSPYVAQNSKQIKRQTRSGKWKITCQADEIRTRDTKALIGTKRILVFYKGRAKTEWVMHEYHMNPKLLNGHSQNLQIPYILCCLKRKASGSLEISPGFEGDSTATDDTAVVSQHGLIEDTDQESLYQATMEALPPIQTLDNSLPSYSSYGTFAPQRYMHGDGQGDDPW